MKQQQKFVIMVKHLYKEKIWGVDVLMEAISKMEAPED